MDLEGIDYDFDAPDSDWNYEPSRAELFRQIPAALYTTDADGWLTYYNDAAAELWGFRPVLGKARWCGSWRLFDVDGTRLAHDECPMAVSLREARAVRGIQIVLERPDGRRVAVMPYPTPLRDESGRVVAGSNILLELQRSYADAFTASRHGAFSARQMA
jgi:PAS domain-containing protein